MPVQDHNRFYSELPLYDLPVSQLLAEEGSFSPVPEDWHVVITDIKGSTQATHDGLHQEVNLVATGSIIAALNLAKEADIAVPFFFGGDGATLLLPPCLLKPVMTALMEHRENTSRNFAMELRVAQMPVSQIYQNGCLLKISRVKMGEKFSIPILLGEGLQFAEHVIKSETYSPETTDEEASILNLEGMECKWDTIKPPKNIFEVVCLIITTKLEAHQARVYKKVLDKIDEIYGPEHSRKPLSVERMQFKATLDKVNTEMLTKLGRFNLVYLVRSWLLSLLGKLYLRYHKKGKRYLGELIEMSDTLVMDGRINTVISGTTEQRQVLTSYLDQMEATGEIVYGLHISDESVISCYVRNRQDQHIHFVDGSGGGYTQAAGMLKRKLTSI